MAGSVPFFGSPAILGLSWLSVEAKARGEARTRGFAALGFPRCAFIEAVFTLRPDRQNMHHPKRQDGDFAGVSLPIIGPATHIRVPLVQLSLEVLPTLELTRFRGHCTLWVRKVHDGKNETAISAGVSPADGRAGTRGPHARGQLRAFLWMSIRVLLLSPIGLGTPIRLSEEARMDNLYL